MDLIPLYITLTILGVLFRYNLGLVQSTKVVGQKLADTPGKNLQDAITPPMLTKASLVTWGLILATLGYLAYAFGLWHGAIGIVVVLGVSVFAGALIIPKPESKHFLLVIYRSIINRCANYEKANDRQRAEAMNTLRQRFEETYYRLFIIS